MKTGLVNRLFLLAVSICLIAQVSGIGLVEASQNPGLNLSSGKVEIQQSTSHELVLTVSSPQFTFETVATGSGTCQVIHAADWTTSAAAGQPELPIKGMLVGLPAQGDPVINVENTGSVRVIDGVQLCPAAGLSLQDTPVGEIPDYAETRVKDASAYLSNRDFPGALAEMGPGGYIRSQRVGDLTVRLFQYNPVLQRLSVYSDLRIRLEFDAALMPASETAVNEGSFEDILQNSVINYSAARVWRNPAKLEVISTSTGFHPESTQPAYRISVSQDGIYRVTYADLLAAGIPAETLNTLDPRTFQIYNRNNQISLLVEGSSPNVFGSQDAFIFFGQKVNTRYTDTNIYWLTWGGTNGERMAAIDGTPGNGTLSGSSQQTVHVEQNQFYINRYPNGPDQDHWYWDVVQAINTTKSKEYTINLTNVSDISEGSAVVRGLLRDYSATTPEHTRIYLNGKMVKEDTWLPNSDYSFEATVDQSLLVNGANTIKVEVVLDTGITLKVILVNWFEIAYTRNNVALMDKIFFDGDTAGNWKYSVSGFTGNYLRILDITDPLHPATIDNSSTIDSGSGQYTLTFQQQITSGHQYTAFGRTAFLSPVSIQKAQPADLLAGSNGADLIIITHPDFLSALQPLVEFHASQGLRTRLVNVQDIYDEFSGGVFDARAIHDFLSYAYASWAGPAPAYVLLVGDGNYDYKNFNGNNEPNYIPPYLADVDPWLGEVPTDNYYVTVSGTDVLPDMAIGRLPVKSVTETTAAVNKILTYSQASYDNWTRKALLIADAMDPTAGNFPRSSDQIASILPRNLTVDKVYYKITQATAPLTTTAILDAINEGRVIVNYVGHASSTFWSKDKIFGTTNINGVANSNRVPFFISMACSSGYFVFPSASGSDSSSLDEMLVRKSSGGAIATFSPVGFGLVSDHDPLNEGVMQAIYRDKVLEFGRVTTQAKYFMYAESGGKEELVETYLLFGDPALQIKPVQFKAYFPTVSKK